MLEKIKQLLKSYAFDGVALILLGLFMLIWPNRAVSAVVSVIGVILIVLALIRIISFITNRETEQVPQDFVVGLLMLGFGIAMLAARGTFVDIIQLILGVLIIYGSALLLINCFMKKKLGRSMFTLSLVLGLITLALGVLVLINPAGISFIVQLRGVALIIEGLSMLIVLARVNKAVNTVAKQ